MSTQAVRYINLHNVLTNLLELYFQVLVLIDAASTDDSVGCCSGPAGCGGDMEG